MAYIVVFTKQTPANVGWPLAPLGGRGYLLCTLALSCSVGACSACRRHKERPKGTICAASTSAYAVMAETVMASTVMA